MHLVIPCRTAHRNRIRNDHGQNNTCASSHTTCGAHETQSQNKGTQAPAILRSLFDSSNRRRESFTPPQFTTRYNCKEWDRGDDVHPEVKRGRPWQERSKDKGICALLGSCKAAYYIALCPNAPILS
eukprot:671588-Rhodomonas_salina.1